MNDPGFEVVEVVEGSSQAAGIGQMFLWIEVAHRAGAKQVRAGADLVQILQGLRISPGEGT
ncbi:hypothetical protein D3C78_1493960 [compost metagenome]